jgi:hypothetical protein
METLRDAMKLRRFSPRTQQSYLAAVTALAKYYPYSSRPSSTAKRLRRTCSKFDSIATSLKPRVLTLGRNSRTPSA